MLFLLFRAFRGGSLTKSSTQGLVALQSLCSFANMLWETYDRFEDAREPEPLSLKGHEDFVNSAAAFPDGERLVTASTDTTTWGGRGTLARGYLDRATTATPSTAVTSPEREAFWMAQGEKMTRLWAFRNLVHRRGS